VAAEEEEEEEEMASSPSAASVAAGEVEAIAAVEAEAADPLAWPRASVPSKRPPASPSPTRSRTSGEGTRSVRRPFS